MEEVIVKEIEELIKDIDEIINNSNNPDDMSKCFVKKEMLLMLHKRLLELETSRGINFQSTLDPVLSTCERVREWAHKILGL